MYIVQLYLGGARFEPANTYNYDDELNHFHVTLDWLVYVVGGAVLSAMGVFRESPGSTPHSFIHLFIQAISIAPLQVHYCTQRRSQNSTDTATEFHAEAPQATASEGLHHHHHTFVYS